MENGKCKMANGKSILNPQSSQPNSLVPAFGLDANLLAVDGQEIPPKDALAGATLTREGDSSGA
jgi:hypothetical protein